MIHIIFFSPKPAMVLYFSTKDILDMAAVIWIQRGERAYLILNKRSCASKKGNDKRNETSSARLQTNLRGGFGLGLT